MAKEFSMTVMCDDERDFQLACKIVDQLIIDDPNMLNKMAVDESFEYKNIKIDRVA